MSSFCYAFGLPVATELEISGAITADSKAGELPAFTVEFGRVAVGVSDLGSARNNKDPYRLVPEGLLFEKQGVASYLCCQGGERLVVDFAEGAAEADVAAYLIATAIPALLWMRGEIVLHGAVAVLPGEEQAVGLLGVSGSGKSRLLLQIAEAGGKVVAEDSFRVWRERSRMMAAGLPGLIHSRAGGSGLQADRKIDRVPKRQQLVSTELSALIVLQTEIEGLKSDEPVRLQGVAAVEAVLRNRHRPRVPDLLGLSAGVLPTCSALAVKLPVYSWEFLQAASRSPLEGGIWRALAGLLQGRV